MIFLVRDIDKEVKLAEDAISELGGVVFKKGTILKPTDIEILEAFGVKQIEIDEFNEDIIANNIKVENQETNELEIFKGIFKKSINALDNILILARGNAQIPILELRKALQPLLKEEYIQPEYLMSLKFNSYNFNKYDSNHALSVGLLAYATAVWMGLDFGERMQIALAGTMHDIGMSRIPNHILLNKGTLNQDEYNEIKKHTLYGYQLLKDAKGINESSLLGILQHHEREDGEGYPLYLKGNQINIYAKIIAVADVFHALISRRIFRKEYSFYQALDLLIKEADNKLDKDIVDVFSKNIAKFPIGTKVLLDNGMYGYIVQINDKHPTRPLINIGNTVLDLLEEKELLITEIY